MIDVKNLFKFLNQNGIKFFSGVPDSILKNINFSSVAIKYKFDYWVHGTDWRKGVQSNSRKQLIKTMKKWNGKVIEVPYTKEISSSKVKKI